MELLDNARLISQLIGLERRTARGGRDSIDHASGMHDDLANAVAGAIVTALDTNKRRILQGSYGYGGPITWWDLERGEKIDPETKQPVLRTRVRVVRA